MVNTAEQEEVWHSLCSYSKEPALHTPSQSRYALLTGKGNRLINLRRGKKTSENYFITAARRLQSTFSSSHRFHLCRLQENTLPTFFSSGEQTAQPTSFNELQSWYLHYLVQNRRCTSLCCTLETLIGKVCIKWVATAWFFDVYRLGSYTTTVSD